MKRIIVKNYEFTSRLGKGVFHNVPIWVEESVTARSFDRNEHTHDMSGDVIHLLAREIATTFYTRFTPSRTLAPEEIAGVMSILEIKAVELAKLLGITKGTVSRILKGTIKMKRPETLLLMEMLKNELMRPGYVRARLEQKRESLPESLLEATYDFSKLPNRAA